MNHAIAWHGMERVVQLCRLPLWSVDGKLALLAGIGFDRHGSICSAAETKMCRNFLSAQQLPEADGAHAELSTNTVTRSYPREWW